MVKREENKTPPMFIIDKDRVEEDIYREFSVYAFDGQGDFEDEHGFTRLDLDEIDDVFDNTEACAIKDVKGSITKYYVKRGKHGELFNPIGMYAEDSSKKKMRHAGKPLWNFKQTTEKVFRYYTMFLQTRNLAHLRNADREV